MKRFDWMSDQSLVPVLQAFYRTPWHGRGRLVQLFLIWKSFGSFELIACLRLCISLCRTTRWRPSVILQQPVVRPIQYLALKISEAAVTDTWNMGLSFVRLDGAAPPQEGR